MLIHQQYYCILQSVKDLWKSWFDIHHSLFRCLFCTKIVWERTAALLSYLSLEWGSPTYVFPEIFSAPALQPHNNFGWSFYVPTCREMCTKKEKKRNGFTYCMDQILPNQDNLSICQFANQDNLSWFGNVLKLFTTVNSLGHFLSDRVAKFTSLHFELIRILKNWLDPQPKSLLQPAIWVHANL